MKTKLNFTRGEWMAAVALLVLMIISYGFYYLYPNNVSSVKDLPLYAAEFEAFEAYQAHMRDSLEHNGRKKWPGDTVPRSSASAQKKLSSLHDVQRLELNSCDSLDLTLVPGIGEKRGALIVKYRDKLGGFYSLQQLKEVFGMQDFDVSKFLEYFYLDEHKLTTINVNTAEYKELIAHPYLDAYMVKCILIHRKKNGKIASLKELQEITHAYPELMERLQHYIVF